MKSGDSLKDELFNDSTVMALAERLKQVYEPFEQEVFIREVMKGFEGLELKERMSHLRRGLEVCLPDDYRRAVGILLEGAAGVEPHFVYGSFCEYVEVRGCNEVDLDFSLAALGDLTKTFSAEFAIRPFINEFPEKTLAAMKRWSLSSDVDQRRLASEGLRPKLPWAGSITIDYKAGAGPLNNLYRDSERYVTRSVANHMNDLSKIDPAFMLEILRRWQAEGRQNPKEMAYIVSHSTRTLVKRGDRDALALLGYNPEAEIEIRGFTIGSGQLTLGDSLVFDFDLTAGEDTRLMVDYIIDYPMAKGRRSEKVFKIKKTDLAEKETLHITKRHPFRAMTTKKLYSGTYYVTLQINGIRYNQGSFVLTV